MPILTNAAAVRALYAEAAQRRWVLPCFCSENLTTTEAVLSAAAEYGQEHGMEDVPVTLALTVNYPHRPQAVHYTRTKDWRAGLALFRSEIEILAGPGGPFEKLRVLVHLDHVQPDEDKGLLAGDLSPYSSIMYDASTRPLDENIRMTAEFVEKNRDSIVVEGACDEIKDADGQVHDFLTAPDVAEDYMKRTGVDLAVANLGTEHRASSQNLRYHGDAARRIRDRIGYRTVLHGTSSVPDTQVAHLFDDGICKVNIWTILERDASPVLLDGMVRNAVHVAGPAKVRELVEAGWLGSRALEESGSSASLTHFTSTSRSEMVFLEMKKIAKRYLDLWYR